LKQFSLNGNSAGHERIAAECPPCYTVIQMKTKYNRSAFKHGMSEAEIETVLQSASTEEFDDDWDEFGRFCIMFVGLNEDGLLREIKVAFEVDPQSEECTGNREIVHANKATTESQRLWNERKKRA
jgi:hypothetical protein